MAGESGDTGKPTGEELDDVLEKPLLDNDHSDKNSESPPKRLTAFKVLLASWPAIMNTLFF